MENQKISVIVPIYNVDVYLERCIESICGQTYRDLEIILVDDGSTDNSGVICDHYAKLLLIGDGELRNELEAQITEKGLNKDVLLLGWRTNVEDYFQAMDIFLLPSRFEALGIAIVEAAASGLPCLVSDQTPEDVAFTEHVRHIPLDVPAWTAALEEASQLRADRQDDAGAVRAAGYDIKRQAKVLEALYEQ